MTSSCDIFKAMADGAARNGAPRPKGETVDIGGLRYEQATTWLRLVDAPVYRRADKICIDGLSDGDAQPNPL